ncbi:MAG: hypothetical protein II777_07620, partial [Clostridia bacterium]|nr:hypothetical protein [Clostridia bacterium]
YYLMIYLKTAHDFTDYCSRLEECKALLMTAGCRKRFCVGFADKYTDWTKVKKQDTCSIARIPGERF